MCETKIKYDSFKLNIFEINDIANGIKIKYLLSEKIVENMKNFCNMYLTNYNKEYIINGITNLLLQSSTGEDIIKKHLEMTGKNANPENIEYKKNNPVFIGLINFSIKKYFEKIFEFLVWRNEFIRTNRVTPEEVIKTNEKIINSNLNAIFTSPEHNTIEIYLNGNYLNTSIKEFTRIEEQQTDGQYVLTYNIFNPK